MSGGTPLFSLLKLLQAWDPIPLTWKSHWREAQLTPPSLPLTPNPSGVRGQGHRSGSDLSNLGSVILAN